MRATKDLEVKNHKISPEFRLLLINDLLETPALTPQQGYLLFLKFSPSLQWENLSSRQEYFQR